jgi:hypothetical protein
LAKPLLILLFSIFCTAGAQEKMPLYTFSVNGGYGVFLAHRKMMQPLVTGHPYQLTLSAAKRLTDDAGADFNHPYVGLRASFYNNYSNAKMGFATALMPFIDFPLQNSPNSRWWLCAASGLGIIQKPFNQQTNHKNIAVGSHLNGAVQFTLKQKIATPHGDIEWGGGLMHFSNGAFKTPNLGINLFTLNAGFTLNKGEATSTPKKENETFSPHFTWHTMATGAAKYANIVYRELHGVFTLNSEWHYVKSKKNSFPIGLDAMYNSALRYRIDQYTSASDNVQIGIHTGYLFTVNKLSMLVNMGVYVRNKAAELGLFYHRLGFRYALSPSVQVHTAIKSHFAVADYIEAGLVIRIK